MVFELDLSKSEYRAHSSFPTLWSKVIFSFPKIEDADFLGHNKYMGRDQRGKLGCRATGGEIWRDFCYNRDLRD